jgi:hypothetical protein
VPKKKSSAHRSPWTKNDLRELKAHSKARTPVPEMKGAMLTHRNIVTPSSVCRAHSVTGENGETKVSSDCQDSIRFTQTTAYIKTSPDGQMIYSPTSDPT